MTNTRVNTMALFDTDTEELVGTRATSSSSKSVERGVSVDQDGKSNVWAIEPRHVVPVGI